MWGVSEISVLRRRPLLLALAAAGAVALLVLSVRRLRRLLSSDVLLVNQGAFYTVVLRERQVLTHNVRLLRFGLPRPAQTRQVITLLLSDRNHAFCISGKRLIMLRLGLRPCQHVYLHAHVSGRVVVRPYTPVSPYDQRGYFDLVVKVYAAQTSAAYPSGGIMSQYLDHLTPGDEIQVTGPKGRFVYEGRGQFSLSDGSRLPLVTHMGLVAAGSGVTPILQLLRHIVADEDDRTDIVLIDVNSTQDDIIVREELEGYASRIRVWHVLSQLPTTGAPDNFLQGRLTQEILAARLPPPGSGTMVLCCGPPRLTSELLKPALKDIGHDRVLFF